MNDAATESREPTDEELEEYMEDAYVVQLGDIADRLVVLSNSIDFEMPPSLTSTDEGDEDEEQDPAAVKGAEGLTNIAPQSEEMRYLKCIHDSIQHVDEAIRLRTRICFRNFPTEEHAGKTKQKARGKQ